MSTSLFEIVGPIMVGPSSSHTAGMARIGMMAHRIAAFEPTEILLRLSPTLRTTYHGHRTDASLIGGALGMNENSTGLRSALEYAAEHNVKVNIEFYPPNIYHPNTAQLEMVSNTGERIHVRGISVGGGSMYIDAIDEQPIHLEPDRYHLVFWGNASLNAFDENAAVQQADGIGAVSFTSRPADELIENLRSQSSITRLRLIEPVLAYGATISELLHLTRCDEAVDMCRQKGISLAQLAVQYEMDRSGLSEEDIRALMHKQLGVMRESARKGMEEDNKMLYGLTSGEDGKRLMNAVRSGKTISGGIVPTAVAKALGIMEHNASMGCIVAAPTAGSAGIVPGCMLTLQQEHGFTDEQIIDALFVSAIIGVIMAHRDVSFSGSVGGCQGEVGVSSAIAAAGIASLFSDDPQIPCEAMAICMKNLLGLVCDPIAGPIEVPCIKRNAVGVANAFISADMACANIASYIPPDQVIDALIDVEQRLPGELRATTTGGLACTHKAVCLRRQLAKELVD